MGTGYLLPDSVGAQVAALLCSSGPANLPFQRCFLTTDSWESTTVFCCHVEAEEETSSEKIALALQANKVYNISYSITSGFCFHSLSQIIREIRNTSVFHDLHVYWYFLDISKPPSVSLASFRVGFFSKHFLYLEYEMKWVTVTHQTGKVCLLGGRCGKTSCFNIT